MWIRETRPKNWFLVDEDTKDDPSGGTIAAGAGPPTPWVGRRALALLLLSWLLLSQVAECSERHVLFRLHSATRDDRFLLPFVGASIMHPHLVPHKASLAAGARCQRTHIPSGTSKTCFFDRSFVSSPSCVLNEPLSGSTELVLRPLVPSWD